MGRNEVDGETTKTSSESLTQLSTRDYPPEIDPSSCGYNDFFFVKLMRMIDRSLAHIDYLNARLILLILTRLS